MAEPDVIASATDPDGRTVDLTTERWRHILDGHPELAPIRGLAMRAVRAPDHRRPGRWPNEEWFYLSTTRPSRWLKVVVRYEEERGRIVTAFARRSLP